MVGKYLPGWDFVCLSDQPLQCKTEPIEHMWPGWWSKMELFKIKGPCLYFDLDTILLADCRHWASRVVKEEFVVLRDFYRGKHNKLSMGSGVMAWRDNVSYILEKYKQNPTFEHQFGDQGFLEQATTAQYIQDFTSSVVSYKTHILEGYPLDKATVVCFHGEPRPWDQKTIPY
jgi:hypothetical protein